MPSVPTFCIFSNIKKPSSPKKTLCLYQNHKNHIYISVKTNIPILSKHPTQTSIMSNKRKTQDKPLIILWNVKEYPDWKSYVISKLQHKSCNWAITNKPKLKFRLVWVALIKESFMIEDLTSAILIAAFRDKKKNYHIGLIKIAGLIKKLVDKNLHLLLNDKNTFKMWIIP